MCRVSQELYRPGRYLSSPTNLLTQRTIRFSGGLERSFFEHLNQERTERFSRLFVFNIMLYNDTYLKGRARKR